MKDFGKNKLVNEELSKIYQLNKHEDHHKLISFKAKAILGMTPPRCRQVRLRVLILILFLKQKRMKLGKGDTTTMVKVVAMSSNVGQRG
jgi:hypothetical protein